MDINNYIILQRESKNNKCDSTTNDVSLVFEDIYEMCPTKKVVREFIKNEIQEINDEYDF